MRLRILVLAFLLAPFGVAGCATLEQIAALRQVRFELAGVDQARLAGVALEGVHSYEGVGAVGAARIGVSVAQGRLPLSFVLNVGAENPADNPVAARMVQMDWTLLLDDQETISGVYNDERLIPPGTRDIIPLALELDLMRFFERSVPDLVGLALAVAGEGQQEIALRVRPTINTPLGPITYPGAITLRHNVGG
jgi:hypothetical protein